MANDLVANEVADDLVLNDDMLNSTVVEANMINNNVVKDKMVIDNVPYPNNSIMNIPKTPAEHNDEVNNSLARESFNNRSATILGGDFYSTEILHSKGFSIKCYGKRRVIVNLKMMSTHLDKHTIVCFGFPTQVTENELIPLFLKFGSVYMLRIITTGLVFVIYTTAEEADRAINALNCSKVNGCLLKVKREFKGRLIMKPIPNTATKRDITHAINAIVKGLVKVSLSNASQNDSINRGFGYLEFKDHLQASHAKHVLSNSLIFGRRLTFEWPGREKELGRFQNPEYEGSADKEIDKRRLGNANVEISFNKLERGGTKPLESNMPYGTTQKPAFGSRTLYISNIRPDLNTSELRKIFTVYGHVRFVDKNDNVVAVRLLDFKDCTRAANQVDKRLLGNENVKIAFVEPVPLDDASDMLYLTNLRCDLRSEDLREFFSVYGEVIEIDKNGCLASLKFLDPNDSKRAAREIDKSKLGKMVEISLTKPNTKSYESQDKDSNTLLINNLRSEITTSDLRMFFSVYGEVGFIDKTGNVASIQFRKSNDAIVAAREIDKKLLGDGNVQISFEKHAPKCAKTVDESSDLLCILNLRQEINSSDLRTIFSVYGEVMEIDLNNGTASIRFRDSKCAAEAAREFDKKLLGDGNVKISLGKPKPTSNKLVNDASFSLYTQNMSADINAVDLRKFFSAYGEIDEIDKNGNFASIRFRKAKVSKYAALEIGKSLLGDVNVKISLAKPRTNFEKTIAKVGVTVEGSLYISNLRSDLKTTDLRKHFSVYGEVGSIERNGNFASIQFRNANDSKRAALYIDKKLLSDETVKILFENPDLKSDKTLVDASDTLYITNLHQGLCIRDLRRLFAKYGKIMELDQNDNTARIRFQNWKQCNAASKIDKKVLGNENV